MENQRLLEIRNSLAILPVLQQRLHKLEQRIEEAEAEMQTIMQQYNEEVMDVDNMKRDSIINSLLRLVRKYEGKLDKEMQEMLSAKLEYDKASDRVRDLYKERNQLNEKLQTLMEKKQTYENELAQREEIIKNSFSSTAYLSYKRLENQRERLAHQVIEIDEAIRAARVAAGTINNAIEHLQSADEWATFDVWTRGGIFSHMAKYDHIDNAQADFNRLSYQISDLQKELTDINQFEVNLSLGIDTTTRMFDFWFDNIFTDLNVRDKIRADKELVNRFKSKIAGIISKLEDNRLEIVREMEAIETRKKDLLISGV